MKLHLKSVVGREIASQRTAQIQEGVAIAKKVDALRETLASLEAQRIKFISGMTGELTKETEGLIARIGELKSEIGELEDKRRQLLIPLDDAWQKVGEVQKSLASEREEIASEKRQIELAKQRLAEKAADIRDRLGKTKVRERELARIYLKAETDGQEAVSIKAKLLEEKESQDARLAAQEAELAKKIAKVDFDERAVLHANELLDFREKAINNKERQVNDRYQTLLRTQARLTK